MSATGMEGEMLLLAMLPHEDERLVIQTPRRRQVGELERFIADEYARVFPHRPALSRDVRLQKCMKTAEVQDRRQPSSSGKSSADGVFVDLGKNVQVGNVFQDMEPVYVVFNKPKLGALPAPHADKKKHDKPAEGAKPHKTKADDDKAGKDAGKEDAKTKRPRSAAAELGKSHEADAAPTKKAKVKSSADKQDTVNDKPAALNDSTKVKAKKSKEVTPSETTKPTKVKKVKETATDADAISSTTPSTTATVDKTSAKKTKKKASEEAADAKQPAAKRQKTEEEVAKEKESLTSKKFGDVLKQQSTTTKSVTPAKIETSTQEKPKKAGRPAKTAGTEEVTTPVVVKKKVGRPSKADIEAEAAATAAAAAGVAAESQAPAPAVVKKKIGRPSNAEKEAAAAAAAALAADNSPTPAQPAVVKKKVGRPSKADKEAAAAGSTAATDVGAAPVKKKVGRPSKADLEAAAAAAAADQTTTSAPVKPAKKLGRPSKADKEAAAAAAAAAGPAGEAPKKLNESKKSPKVTEKGNGDGETEQSSNGSETKVRRKVLLTFTERLAAARADVAQQHKMAQGEVEASEPKADHTDPKPSVKKSTPAVENPKASPKVSPKVASKVSPKVSSVKPKVVASPPVQVPEPSSDSDSSATELEDSLPSKKPTSEKARPAVVTKSPSSSDSDSSDEELDYSQSLLADLTKHGSEEEDSDVPSPVKPKAKKLNKVVLSQSDDVVTDSQDSVSSVDIPLAQSSQETNSLLMSSLAKNRFSLDRIPVAKLKKSSKNPFSQDSGIKVVKRHGLKSKSQ